MPPDSLAPDPVSADGIVIVIVFDDGTVVTINLMLSKLAAAKSELVAVEKLSNNIISPAVIPWSVEKFIVTVVDPLVVLKAFVSVVVDLIGCMS